VVSNPIVTAKSILRRIPWKFALPATSVLLTLYFIHLDALWSIGAGKWDDMAVTSASGLVGLINGPVAILLGGLKLRAYLVVGAAFWAWTGYLFDRRLRGIRESTIRRRWVRWILYALGFALACLVLLASAESLRFYHMHYLSFLSRVLKSPTPHRKLLGRDVITIAMLGWGVGYLIYFSRKLWSLAISPSLG
jgi:hypothetical protein